MSRLRRQRAFRVVLGLVALACGAMAAGSAGLISRYLRVQDSLADAVPITDAVSRELTLHNDTVAETAFPDTLSRELTVHNDTVDDAAFADAVSREITLHNDSVDATAFPDALSRELTVHNDVVDESAFADAVSRELTVHNDTVDEAAFGDAVSREFAVHNTGVTAFTDAVSRELSVHNDAVDETAFSDALSRELTVHNATAGETVLGDAISREFTVYNTGACEDCELPDLIVTTIAAPASGIEGQSVTLTWTVRNQGTAIANGSWTDRVYLSIDGAIGDDTLVGSFGVTGPLAVVAEYTLTRSVNLPPGQLGPRQLIVITDATDTVDEGAGEGNNAQIHESPIEILPTPLPDLAASNVVAPASAEADQQIEITWTVTNVGDATAVPVWLDTVYLTSGAAGDIPLGSQPRTSLLPARAAYLGSQFVTVPGHLEGTFEVFVRTDSLDAVAESGDPANNIAYAAGAIAITQPPRPNLVPEGAETPASGVAGATFNAGFTVVNHGEAAATGVWFDRIIAVNTATNVETVLGDVSHSRELSSIGSYPVSAPFNYPLTAGEYRLKVVTDRTNNVNEGLTGGENDNTALSNGTFVVASYAVSVHAGIETGVNGTSVPLTVPLSGQATLFGTGEPVTDALVAIGVEVQGTRRVITKDANGQTLRTDANGMYQTVFRPLPTEAGQYLLTAGPPQNIEPKAQDMFILYGMKSQPALVDVIVQPGGSAGSELTLTNLGDVPLTGLMVVPERVPAGIEVLVDRMPVNLGPLEHAIVTYLVSATARAAGPASVTLAFTSTEGATAHTELNIVVQPPMAQLVLEGPSPVSSAMLRSLPAEPRQTFVSFSIRNVGGASTGPLTVLLPPDTPWMAISTPEALAPLSPGQSTVVGLILTPASDQALGDYTGQIVVNGSDAAVAVPFRFTAVSDLTASLHVIAEDEASYLAIPPVPLASAIVTLHDASTGVLAASGETSAAGDIVFDGLVEGHYNLEVRADAHGTHRSLVAVNAAQANEVRAFLPMQTVTYTWEVVPTEIEDEYSITLDVTFVTNVPAPVVRVTPAFVDLATLTAEYTQVDFEVTNDGLIAANDVSLSFLGSQRFEITALVTELGNLAPQAIYTVPVIIHDREFGLAAGATGDTCGASGSVEWSLFCGVRRYYTTPIIFDDPQSCPGSGGNGAGSGGFGVGSGAPDHPFVNVPSIGTPQPCCFVRIETNTDTTLMTCDDLHFGSAGFPAPGEMAWSAAGGEPDAGTGLSFDTEFKTPGIKMVTATWTVTATGQSCTDSVNVNLTHECPPDPELDRWNCPDSGPRDSGCRDHELGNNCYEYGLNRVASVPDKAQPGAQAGFEMNRCCYPSDSSCLWIGPRDCPTVIQAVRADLGADIGFPDDASPDPPGSCPPGSCLVALVVGPCYDYHWYRRNEDMSWSHKQGGFPAESIPAPSKGSHPAKSKYPEWCGYWCLPCGEIAVPTIPDFEFASRGFGVVAEVDAFSGVPNPSWTITEGSELDQLREMFATMFSSPIDPPEWHPEAGFRGFRLFNRDFGVPDFPYHVLVTNGFVAVTTVDETKYHTSYYRDDVGLAEFLRVAASDQGFSFLLP